MKIIRNKDEMRAASASLRRSGKRIGLVPTMGFLHEGHLSLVDAAREESDAVVLSVYVNPLQFGPNEDLERYPRDLRRDAELCRARGVGIIFNPDADCFYEPDRSVLVEEGRISGLLCGASRPGHFTGVLTVVSKLFNVVQPDAAVFGQKDAQQARLIEQMVRDLDFPVRIIRGRIVREPDGLAMSSRNEYLSESERKDALCLVKALKTAGNLYDSGERSAAAIVSRISEQIALTRSAQIDYVEIVAERTFARIEKLDEPAVVALAVRVGRTRLIDNIILPENRLSGMPD